MTKTVRDGAIMLQAMAGNDPKDSTSANIKVPNFEALLTGDIKGKTIGIPKEYRLDGMPNEIEKLWSDGTEMLRQAGAKIENISLPHTKYALPAYYVIAPAEASSNLARYDGVRYGRRAALGIRRRYKRNVRKDACGGLWSRSKKACNDWNLCFICGILRRIL
jgi:aspartyl-tRNA(Asn)/glutamyl-tRNA(Gln) amidotransferase subunit A